jgi:hypothetical protein
MMGRIGCMAMTSARHMIYSEPVRICPGPGGVLPCKLCGWYPGIESTRAYPLNDAVKQTEKSMAKKTKKKRGKGC